MNVTPLERNFVFNGMTLPDPNPETTVEQVRDIYVNTYPELAMAAIEGPKTTDTSLTYTFVASAGIKG